MKNDDWLGGRVDYSLTPADNPISLFTRAMMGEVGRDGKALFSATRAGRVADDDAFIDLAKSLGNLLVMPLGRQNYNRWMVSEQGKKFDDNIVIGIENGLIVLSSSRGRWWMVFVIADRESMVRDVCETLEQQFVPVEDEPDRDIRLLVNRRGQLVAERGGDVSAPFERENYPANVADAFERVVEFLVELDPSGRLCLLEGPPGTGKSYFLRGAMNRVPDCTYVYVPAALLGSLTGPTLMQVIIDLRDDCIVRTTVDEEGRRRRRRLPVVLLMEDADHGIVRRAVDNFSVLSEIANLCDGIPGQVLDVRVIATTNAPRLDIDEAILRPGRLAQSVVFPLLNQSQAQEIYDRLTKNRGEFRFDEDCSLAAVYQAARGEPQQSRPARKEGVTGFARS